MVESSNRNNIMLPLVVSLWFSLLGLYVLMGHVGQLKPFAIYVSYFSQDVCDFMSVILCFLIFRRVDEARKSIFILLTLAFAFLASTDILFHYVFHETAHLPMVLRPGYLRAFIVDIPFLCFILFFSLASIKFYRAKASQSDTYSVLVNVAVIASGSIGLAVFICVLNWGSTSIDSVGCYMIFQTAAGLTGFVMALLIMSRIESRLSMMFVGFFMLMLVDYSINVRTAIHFDSEANASMLANTELVWLLAVMLMTGGLLQYFFANRLNVSKS